jgi:uncharacterized protein YvpB
LEYDKRMKRAIPILLFLVLLGCATTNNVKEYPPSYRLAVGPIKQAYNACAPTAVAIVLQFYGDGISPQVISDWAQKAMGTPLDELEWFVASQHYKVHIFRDWRMQKPQIKHFIASGYPVIIGGQSGRRDQNHLTVIIGYDDEKGIFYLAEPSTGSIIEVSYRVIHDFQNAYYENIRFYSMVIFPKMK